MPDRTVRRIGPILNLNEHNNVNANITMEGMLIKLRGFEKNSALNSIPLLNRPSVTMDVSEKTITAAAIIPAVAGLIPDNMPLIAGLDLNLEKNNIISIIIIKLGRTTPTVATTDPATPPALYPTYVAAFMAIGPGVIWDNATTSENSDGVIILKFVISWKIMGRITYPPPNANKPTLKKI